MTYVEILITATIKECGEEDEKTLRSDFEDKLASCMEQLKGNNTTKKGMWNHLIDVEHEFVYEDEGRFEFEPVIKTLCHKCSKLMTPECKGGSQTRLYNHVVSCTIFSRRKTEPIKSD